VTGGAPWIQLAGLGHHRRTVRARRIAIRATGCKQDAATGARRRPQGSAGRALRRAPRRRAASAQVEARRHRIEQADRARVDGRQASDRRSQEPRRHAPCADHAAPSTATRRAASREHERSRGLRLRRGQPPSLRADQHLPPRAPRLEGREHRGAHPARGPTLLHLDVDRLGRQRQGRISDGGPRLHRDHLRPLPAISCREPRTRPSARSKSGASLVPVRGITGDFRGHRWTQPCHFPVWLRPWRHVQILSPRL
jgi:hypothetical protein